MSGKSTQYIDHVMSMLGLRMETSTAAGSENPDRAGHARVEAPTHGELAASQQKQSQIFDAQLEKLAARLKTGDSFIAGRVHLINIDKVRDRLGDRWPKFAQRVHETIKTELKIRLSPRDFFRQIGDDSYVIVFGDCAEAEARIKISLLSEQILEKLLGEAEAKDIGVLGIRRLVVKANGSLAAEALDRTAPLLALLDEAQQKGENGNTLDFADVAAGRRALTDEEVGSLVGNVDTELEALERSPAQFAASIHEIDRLQYLVRQLESLEEAMRAKVPAFAPISEHETQQSKAVYDNIRQLTIKRIQDTRERVKNKIVFIYDRNPPSLSQGSEELPFDIEFRFQPMWHATIKMVGVYVCQATLRDKDGTTIQAADLGKHRDGDVLPILDRLTLRKAQESLTRANEAGAANIVVVPVHFSTLSRLGSQMSFSDLCRNLPDKQRKTLGWEILRSHHDSWRLHIKSAIRPLLPFGRAVLLRIDNLQFDPEGVRRNLQFLRLAGVHGVGLDLSTLHGSEAEKLRALEQLASWSEQDGLKCYGHGFQTLSMTISAVCMGYYSISGPAIGENTPEPVGVRAFKMANIYGRILFGGAVTAS